MAMTAPPNRQPQAKTEFPPALWELSWVLREIASGTTDKQAPDDNDRGSVNASQIPVNSVSKNHGPKR